MGNKKDSLSVSNSVSATYDKPIHGSKFFGVRKNNTIVLGADTYRKNEAEKILWYLIEYLGAKRVFTQLANKLGYEIEE